MDLSKYMFAGAPYGGPIGRYYTIVHNRHMSNHKFAFFTKYLLSPFLSNDT